MHDAAYVVQEQSNFSQKTKFCPESDLLLCGVMPPEAARPAFHKSLKTPLATPSEDAHGFAVAPHHRLVTPVHHLMENSVSVGRVVRSVFISFYSVGSMFTGFKLCLMYAHLIRPLF
ncbi:hypothetical protein O3P69_019016 [Scylla paramamosain]|uniref:Uncharacterized protein n=1 Tax=Scylla paramamosain TaxID=85552 RepID=A0AAW0T722_SCYPA